MSDDTTPLLYNGHLESDTRQLVSMNENTNIVIIVATLMIKTAAFL